jgi:hypothetical protein
MVTAQRTYHTYQQRQRQPRGMAVARFVRMLLLVVLAVTELAIGRSNIKEDIENNNGLLPIKPEGRIFFWRPQKVGSSTVLSLLLSYSFRYNVINRRRGVSNGMCLKIADCYNNGLVPAAVNASAIKIPYSTKDLQKLESKKETAIEAAKYQMVVGHHICNLPHQLVSEGLKCAFENNNKRNAVMLKIGRATDQLKEIFVVREPLNRAISIYYFWGELYKMKFVKSGKGIRPSRKKNSADVDPYARRTLLLGEKPIFRLGEADIEETEIVGKLFKYHGNESSAPPHDIAMSFAKNLPLKSGMPGPSHTWSLFSDNVADAVSIIASTRMTSVVTERLDESLVVASHYLNWTIADVVVASYRKALSSHPKHTDWPAPAVTEITRKLHASGEYKVYNAANAKLDASIAALKGQSVNFDAELRLLRILKDRIAQVQYSYR